ncbi:hypothetical protein JG491_37645 [Streptomyces sp. CRPSP2-6A1]|uniref:hypothetical protein n=1 Tax=Streptomyces sp. CRPSP2-6A1 TaxID=2799588 RepID=UPI0018F095CC|nr:hypothetical protein [Streptomyces sp. CRPSP2-6A1]MBJ7005686.1 hypothetical protein [Streptomyces sp. CRPSP2-6A1]
MRSECLVLAHRVRITGRLTAPGGSAPARWSATHPVRTGAPPLGGRCAEVVRTEWTRCGGAERTRAGALALAGVAVRSDAGVIAHLGERALETAQSVGREIERFHVRTGLPRGPQRRHVDRRPAAGLRLPAVVRGGGRLGGEQLLWHRRLLVGDDVVRLAPHSGGGGGAQPLADHRGGEDGALVLERDAGPPTPHVLVRRPWNSRLAGIGRGLPVRARYRATGVVYQRVQQRDRQRDQVNSARLPVGGRGPQGWGERCR